MDETRNETEIPALPGRRRSSSDLVNELVDSLIAQGVDLQALTLDEIKDMISAHIRATVRGEEDEPAQPMVSDSKPGRQHRSQRLASLTSASLPIFTAAMIG